ncbi:hypothetical protein CIW48_19090 [Methylobacterium sp. P1-11]|nr:hypothetical protein CIW48_19090 [Methylobacterium sp. P1-11]
MPRRPEEFRRPDLGGSAYDVLQRVLLWVTGKVSLHHVHRLNSHVPDVRLPGCLDDHETLGQVGPQTPRDSLRCHGFAPR